MDRTFLRIAALLAFLGVALGAFGAHGLKPLLLEKQSVQTWETAVFYHLIHAVALLVLAGWQPVPKRAASCFVVGILVFSGSLYLLALTGLKVLGAITPLGGVAFLAGWIAVGFGRSDLARKVG